MKAKRETEATERLRLYSRACSLWARNQVRFCLGRSERYPGMLPPVPNRDVEKTREQLQQQRRLYRDGLEETAEGGDRR
jgi:hypothetical protein